MKKKCLNRDKILIRKLIKYSAKLKQFWKTKKNTYKDQIKN